ncbi:MAG: tetratricopeptide repeat protein, partial [Gemmatimonadales bacterium]
MVDLLSTKLDGAGGWRRVDPRAVLAHSGSGGEPLDPAAGQATAQRFHARFYVLGNVVEIGGRVRLDASLYDAERGTNAVADATVEGTAEEIFDLLDDLASQLLLGRAELPGLGVASIAAVTTDSLDALKAYLEVELEFRAGRHREAVDAFHRATRLDTTFALAWYRLGVAADWLVLSDLITSSAERAYRYADKLSDHDRRLFEALQAVRRAEVEKAERLYRGILRSYPDDVEAWFQLGELLFHFGPFVGRSIAESREAFQTVLYYEPDDVHAYPHLARIAAAEGDAAEL